jgi:hypothetical protein
MLCSAADGALSMTITPLRQALTQLETPHVSALPYSGVSLIFVCRLIDLSLWVVVTCDIFAFRYAKTKPFHLHPSD